MALNYEKLLQLRDNYAKPKFAAKECHRRLQRHPNDPYLLAWKAEITARTDASPAAQVLAQCQVLSKRTPPITDPRLLQLLYGLLVNVNRTAISNPSSISSAGSEAQQFWQNAAKSARSAKERAKLFSTLFATALEADCWEDVRWALLQYRKDDLTHKKAVFFDLILAYQLTYEKQSQTGEPTASAKLQKDLAYRNVLQVIKNSSAESERAERITESKDIRFLAQVLRRQKRGQELLQILDDTPAIKHILNSISPEFLQLRLDVLEEEGLWSELWKLSSSLLHQAIKESQGSARQASLNLLQNWKIYTRLLSASVHLWNEEEVRYKTLELCKRVTNLPSQSRETLLLWLSFTANVQKEDLLPACIAYWKRSHKLNCCFGDLRPSIERLAPSDQKHFLAAINPMATDLRPQSGNIDQSFITWFMAEINVLKFEYLITISCHKDPKETVIEPFVISAIKLYTIGSRMKLECAHEAGCLALIGLGLLHHARLSPEAPSSLSESPNERILTQAVLLIQHLTSGDSGKKERPLLLLATRLLLFCGLGTIAFDLYSHARVKEMLNETCSHVLLTGISQTHPFDVTGRKKAHSESELVNIIRTVERMEDKVDEFLSTDLDRFQFDQAFEMRGLKQKLRSSLVKHLCTLERRRIARLKGDPVDQLLNLELQNFDILPLTDNRDFEILPNYEHSKNRSIDHLFMIGPYPDFKCYSQTMNLQDHIYRTLFKESDVSGVAARMSAYWDTADNESQNTDHPVVASVLPSWRLMRVITDDICDLPVSRKSGTLENDFSSLTAELSGFQHRLETLGTTRGTKSTVDERVLPGEAWLCYFYGYLELLRAAWKMCEVVRSIHNQKAAHRLKKEVSKKTVDGLAAKVEGFYKSLRREAERMAERLRTVGEKVLRAQARWGSTGKTLMDLLSEEECTLYAREIVDSALESLRGVLKVKLK